MLRPGCCARAALKGISPAPERASAAPFRRLRRLSSGASLATAMAMLVILTGAGPAAQAASFRVTRVIDGLELPVYVTSSPSESRLYTAEQHSGAIRTYDRHSGTLAATPFLTVDDLAVGREAGLLGLAFHPDYATNGFVYVNRTRNISGQLHTEITRYQRMAGSADRADPASETPVLRYAQPFNNHNGGWLGFGPDGYLYITSGDGGGRNDPAGNGQSLDTLLGKILRIDVDGDDFAADPARNYAIPDTNPFAGVAGADEIWAYGLRNPWRASFDRLTGDFYFGDVGQGAREEVSRQVAGSAGGENYGWRVREGRIATPDVGGPATPDMVEPIHDYPRGSDVGEGAAVTGGYLYRGPVTELQGKYIFGDFVSAQVWAVAPDGTGFVDLTDAFTPDVGSIDSISSFGEDSEGNLYLVDLDGEVFMLQPVPLPGGAVLLASAGLVLIRFGRRRKI
jgi:glucose/arabinose dehydrogenase